VFLQPEGVDDEGGTGVVRRTAQHAIAGGVVEVLLLVAAAGIPLGQVVENVVGQLACAATNPWS
jgi:hypothetical protein